MLTFPITLFKREYIRRITGNARICTANPLLEGIRSWLEIVNHAGMSEVYNKDEWR